MAANTYPHTYGEILLMERVDQDRALTTLFGPRGFFLRGGVIRLYSDKEEHLHKPLETVPNWRLGTRQGQGVVERTILRYNRRQPVAAPAPDPVPDEEAKVDEPVLPNMWRNVEFHPNIWRKVGDDMFELLIETNYEGDADWDGPFCSGQCEDVDEKGGHIFFCVRCEAPTQHDDCCKECCEERHVLVDDPGPVPEDA